MKQPCTSKCLGFLVLATVMAVSATAPSWAEPPSFLGLGFATPTSQVSGASAISADGRYIIGGDSFGCDPDGVCTGMGWIWHEGQFQSLDALVGAAPTQHLYASGISGDGATLVLSDHAKAQSFLWRGGVLTQLSPGTSDPPWLEQDWATAISDDGQTIAGWHYDVPFVMEAWQLRDGNRVQLGDLQGDPDYVSSVANGISGDGTTIVGGSISSFPYFNEAFRWSDGHMTGLGYLRDEIIADPDFPDWMLYPASDANAASYDGSVIVGNSPSYNTRRNETEAFRLKDGEMIGLGDLPGGAFYSDALSVSADGSIVVGYSVTGIVERAFIWDEVHGMRLLEDVLADAGLDLQGWQLRIAKDISADGTVIVGYGVNPLGYGEAFRAVIPEPASLLLVILGMAVISWRRLPDCRKPARL